MGLSGRGLLVLLEGDQTRAKMRPCGCSTHTSVDMMLRALEPGIPIVLLSINEPRSRKSLCGGTGSTRWPAVYHTASYGASYFFMRRCTRGWEFPKSGGTGATLTTLAISNGCVAAGPAGRRPWPSGRPSRPRRDACRNPGIGACLLDPRDNAICSSTAAAVRRADPLQRCPSPSECGAEGGEIAGLAEHFVHLAGVLLLRIDHLPGILLEHHGPALDQRQKLPIVRERFGLGGQ